MREVSARQRDQWLTLRVGQLQSYSRSGIFCARHIKGVGHRRTGGCCNGCFVRPRNITGTPPLAVRHILSIDPGGSEMKTVITLEELAEADLRPYKEIWLTSPEALEGGHNEDELCLWRSDQTFTHDMLSEGTHDQNVTGVWLVVDDIDDPDQVLFIEDEVRLRLQTLGLKGEFYPAERGDGHAAAVH